LSFSQYIVYADESGDHSLISIDKDYPIFVLVFVIFKKENYLEFVKELKDFKFKYFGHDAIILHENEIRRQKGPFKILYTKEKKEKFLNDLTEIIKNAKCNILNCIIDKTKLINCYQKPKNPYNLSLKFLLTELNNLIDDKGLTHIIIEARGNKEDNELKEEFLKINNKMPFELIISHKQSNSEGMQLADLIARPIGRKYLKPNQPNKAFDVLSNKLVNIGDFYGVKIFP